MGLIDKKTGEPWPVEYANLKLQAIRQCCREDLWALDEKRGVTGLRVTDIISDPEDKEGLGKTKEIVNEAKRAVAHTGGDLNRLLAKRWAEYCAEPRDLAEFIATTRLPKEEELRAARDAAEDLEAAIAEPAIETAAAPIRKPVSAVSEKGKAKKFPTVIRD